MTGKKLYEVWSSSLCYFIDEAVQGWDSLELDEQEAWEVLADYVNREGKL
jgi:hypothetical protein